MSTAKPMRWSDLSLILGGIAIALHFDMMIANQKTGGYLANLKGMMEARA